MKTCETCLGASTIKTTVPQYDADLLGAPFKVYLHDAVRIETCLSCECVINTAIPDPEGLLYTVAFTRALHPRKLSGPEIKFLRHAMSWPAKRLAEELGITTEHLSRCENGHLPLSVTTEKLLRLVAILRPGASDKETSPEAHAKAVGFVQDAVTDLVKSMGSFRIEPTWDASDPLEFHFYRRAAATIGGHAPEGDSGKWKPEQRAA